MISINEQQIAAWAPNPAAASNGRKISQKGGFVRLERSEDDTFYCGECTGSGKSNYLTSADFLDPGAPVFRCSCPSRQFPCKHALALLYEIVEGKPFQIREIPEDILQKRAKKEARSAKAASSPASTEEKSKTPRKGNKAARAKKLQKQLDGLELTAKVVRELFNMGLGAMGGTALDSYRELSKQLGDYYLPGPQRLLNAVILEMEDYQEDGEERHHAVAAHLLEKLWALIKKSRQYLTRKLEAGAVDQDDNLLFEELGGVWKLDELAALGLTRENARLAQLAFWVTKDEARAAFTDTGCWVDLDTGEVCFTYNYRPFKALKYVKQDDTVFGAVTVPSAAFYPGEGNRRVRWESVRFGPLESADLEAIHHHAAPALLPEMKKIKNILKNTMSDPMFCMLIQFSHVGKIGEIFVLQDTAGTSIALGDVPDMEPSVHRLGLLPDPALLEHQTMLGAIWYDGAARRMKLQPLSIVTGEDIVRLLY